MKKILYNMRKYNLKNIKEKGKNLNKFNLSY